MQYNQVVDQTREIQTLPEYYNHLIKVIENGNSNHFAAVIITGRKCPFRKEINLHDLIAFVSNKCKEFGIDPFTYYIAIIHAYYIEIERDYQIYIDHAARMGCVDLMAGILMIYHKKNIPPESTFEHLAKLRMFDEIMRYDIRCTCPASAIRALINNFDDVVAFKKCIEICKRHINETVATKVFNEACYAGKSAIAEYILLIFNVIPTHTAPAGSNLDKLIMMGTEILDLHSKGMQYSWKNNSVIMEKVSRVAQ